MIPPAFEGNYWDDESQKDLLRNYDSDELAQVCSELQFFNILYALPNVICSITVSSFFAKSVQLGGGG